MSICVQICPPNGALAVLHVAHVGASAVLQVANAVKTITYDEADRTRRPLMYSSIQDLEIFLYSRLEYLENRSSGYTGIRKRGLRVV